MLGGIGGMITDTGWYRWDTNRHWVIYSRSDTETLDDNYKVGYAQAVSDVWYPVGRRYRMYEK